MQPSRLTLFALLTAWTNLLHQLSYPEWIKGLHPIGWLLFLVSVALAIRPSSFPLFVGLMVLRVIYTAVWIPMIRGHLFLEGLFTVGILVVLLVEVMRSRKLAPVGPVEEEAWFDRFAPLLRVTTLVVYAAATLSKLNVDFLDVQKSAAVQLLLWSEQTSGFTTGPWLQQASIWGTLLIEGGIPILLCFRRTRWLAIAIALFFHTLLGFLPLKIASFSLTMYLLLFTWLPRESAGLIHQGWLGLNRRLAMQPESLARLLTGVALITGFGFALRNGIGPQVRTVDLGLGIWWWQTALMAAALLWLRAAKPEPTMELLRQNSWANRIFLAVILFNCACPYIGLKTRTTLTMHCNLRTEKGYWNHLFLPERMRFFGYQDDLVTIRESNLPDLAFVASKRMPLPYFEFRRWCRLAREDYYVVYQRGESAPRRFERQGGVVTDPELISGSPALEWFLCFNPVGASHDYMPGFVNRVGPARNVVPDIVVPTDQ